MKTVWTVTQVYDDPDYGDGAPVIFTSKETAELYALNQFLLKIWPGIWAFYKLQGHDIPIPDTYEKVIGLTDTIQEESEYNLDTRFEVREVTIGDDPALLSEDEIRAEMSREFDSYFNSIVSWCYWSIYSRTHRRQEAQARIDKIIENFPERKAAISEIRERELAKCNYKPAPFEQPMEKDADVPF